MPKVKITGYSDYWRTHEVKGESNCKLMEVMVTGGFPSKINPRDLIGKTIEFDRTHPFIEIAYGCRIVEEGDV